MSDIYPTQVRVGWMIGSQYASGFCRLVQDIDGENNIVQVLTTSSIFSTQFVSTAGGFNRAAVPRSVAVAPLNGIIEGGGTGVCEGVAFTYRGIRYPTRGASRRRVRGVPARLPLRLRERRLCKLGRRQGLEDR